VHRGEHAHLPFAFSPISTRRRIASERPNSFLTDQDSIASTIPFGKRVEIIGSTPSSLFGRPRALFLRTKIDFFIFLVYNKCRPEGTPSAPARCHLGRARIMTCLTIVFVTAVVAATFVALIMAIVQAARHWED
jgi:hypothetical protein